MLNLTERELTDLMDEKLADTPLQEGWEWNNLPIARDIIAADAAAEPKVASQEELSLLDEFEKTDAAQWQWPGIARLARRGARLPEPEAKPMPRGLEEAVCFLTNWASDDLKTKAARHVRTLIAAVKRGVTLPQEKPDVVVGRAVVELSGPDLSAIAAIRVRLDELETNAGTLKGRVDNDAMPRLTRLEKQDREYDDVILGRMKVLEDWQRREAYRAKAVIGMMQDRAAEVKP